MAPNRLGRVVIKGTVARFWRESSPYMSEHVVSNPLPLAYRLIKLGYRPTKMVLSGSFVVYVFDKPNI